MFCQISDPCFSLEEKITFADNNQTPTFGRRRIRRDKPRRFNPGILSTSSNSLRFYWNEPPSFEIPSSQIVTCLGNLNVGIICMPGNKDETKHRWFFGLWGKRSLGRFLQKETIPPHLGGGTGNLKVSIGIRSVTLPSGKWIGGNYV